MKNAVLSRHRRLLVLCACSAAAHFVVLELLARHGANPFAPAPAPVDAGLSVRLVPARAARTPPAPPPVAAPAPVPAPPRPRRAPSPPAAVPTTPPALPAAAPASAAPDAAPAPASPGATASGPAPEPGPPLMQMPDRYRVRLPPSCVLTYDVVRQPASGAPVPAGIARLTWRTDGDRYVLDLDGALGRLHSEGASGDAGIVPRRALEETDAAPLVTEFDADGHRVLFRATGTESPDNVGIQDRASLLMQLAGIGLAEPDQIRDSVDVVVAGARDLRIAHFRVLGQEDVATGAGTFSAWHLAELAAPGVARLDVWLAPERNWLPVRLSVDDGGARVTQTLGAIGPAPEPPGAGAR